MSQLVKAIEVIDTGRRKVKMSPLFEHVASVNEQWKTSYIYGETAKQYRVQLKLTSEMCVREGHSLTMTESVERAKNQLIEAVFGEFRPHFRLIEQAIYNHEIERAGQLLYEMEKLMYSAE